MKHVLVAFLALTGTMHALHSPIGNARRELEENKQEILALKKDLTKNALPKIEGNLARLKDSQEKIAVGQQRVEETQKQMGVMRGFAKVLDPLERRNLGQLSQSYKQTAAKVQKLSEQFAELAGPLTQDLLQTKKDLTQIVQKDGLIDQITKAQDSALSRLQGVKSFIFGGYKAPDADASRPAPASQ